MLRWGQRENRGMKTCYQAKDKSHAGLQSPGQEGRGRREESKYLRGVPEV